MIIKYEPKIEEFSGYVEIDIPGRKKRYEALSGLVSSENEDETIANVARAKGMLDLQDTLAKYVNKVKIKHQDKKTFNSFEALEEDAVCDDLIDELIGVFLNGKVLGE